MQHLRDRYLDTPARDLWQRRLALLERAVDGRRLLALKGELGPRERLEVEELDDDAGRGSTARCGDTASAGSVWPSA